MKIGIIQFDSVLQQYQGQFGDYDQMLIHLLQQADPTLKFETYAITDGQYPQTLKDCDAYVTTGSKDSVYETLPWMERFKPFLHELYEQNIKLAGICFGHQLVAEWFGGKTLESNMGWGVGVSQHRVINPQFWMRFKLDQFNLVVSHKDQVEQLPPGAVLLAGNDFCPNAMYQFGSFLCMQGHPEFSKAYSQTMMQHRRDKLGPKVLEQGLESLKQDVQDREVGQWIVSFFNS